MADIKVLEKKADFDELVKVVKAAGDKAIIIDFHASWCGPCKMIKPFFQEMAASHPGIVSATADVDDADDLAELMEVQAMPTFVVFKGGQKIDSMTGASKEKLKALFDKYN